MSERDAADEACDQANEKPLNTKTAHFKCSFSFMDMDQSSDRK